MLLFRARVEAHYEVVAVVGRNAVLADRSGQQEHAPIGEPADYAFLLQDEGAGRVDDSTSTVNSVDGEEMGRVGGRTL